MAAVGAGGALSIMSAAWLGAVPDTFFHPITLVGSGGFPLGAPPVAQTTLQLWPRGIGGN